LKYLRANDERVVLVFVAKSFVRSLVWEHDANLFVRFFMKLKEEEKEKLKLIYTGLPE
jgi:hypothetical protein